jgi:tetratricopeptide (TPR) repeat protein
MEGSNSNRFRQVTALLKIVYTELQYWLVGMTPEGYHFQQSRNYEQLGASKRSAHHSHQVLRYAEYSEPRARLGYYFAMQAKYAEAAEHYRKAIQNWPHPSILLALAQVELRIGNHQAATALVERVEASEMNDQLAAPIAEVRSELKKANNGMQATCADARA